MTCERSPFFRQHEQKYKSDASTATTLTQEIYIDYAYTLLFAEIRRKMCRRLPNSRVFTQNLKCHCAINGINTPHSISAVTYLRCTQSPICSIPLYAMPYSVAKRLTQKEAQEPPFATKRFSRLSRQTIIRLCTLIRKQVQISSQDFQL